MLERILHTIAFIADLFSIEAWYTIIIVATIICVLYRKGWATVFFYMLALIIYFTILSAIAPLLPTWVEIAIIFIIWAYIKW